MQPNFKVFKCILISKDVTFVQRIKVKSAITVFKFKYNIAACTVYAQ